ncbi:N-acetyltransferase [Amycolatopsis sp. NPDC059021]|uniref:acyltransferase n=1 Tax=Amycolatopsis sp. NPDC059021 TaxID=3346704 RepID=UPI00366FC7C0
MITTDGPIVQPTAIVAATARIGSRTRIWHHVQVADKATIGDDCILGTGCYIGARSRIGDRVKIGNHCDVFGAIIESEAMLSPHVVLTEDPKPRATRPDGQPQRPGDWTARPVTVRRGATLSAGARVAPGVDIGPHALVGIGAVVLRDVPAHALVLGNPARQCGWVCHCGHRLTSQLACPRCRRTFELATDRLREQAPAV